jgi:multiple sugar transport system substrate-binding protein
MMNQQPSAPGEALAPGAPATASARQPQGDEPRSAGQPAISRRSFLRAMGLVTAGAALAACGVTPRQGRRGIAQLVYQDWRTEWFAGMAQQMLEQFHALHPDINVFFAQDPEDLANQMLSDFQSGTAPDVFAGCCDFLPVWAQKGYLLDLRPFVEADLDRGDLGDWDAAQYRALFDHTGAQFALPKYHGALALYYNKDLLDQYGVEYPDGTWTHDDYLQAMKGLVRPLDRGGRISLWGSMLDIDWGRLQVHVNGWGGHFVDPQDPARSLMAEPEALAALRWLHERMWGDSTMASPLDVQNVGTRRAFIEQRVAMVEEGSWALKDILEHADFRVGVASFPAGPARKVTLATTDGFAIYAGTRYPEAAWELLKFLVSPDYGRAMARAHLLQPARASLVDDWVGLIREQYPEKTREMDLAVFAEGHLQGYAVTEEVFANMAEARRLAQAAWFQIFSLGQAQVELLRSVSAQIEAAQRVSA